MATSDLSTELLKLLYIFSSSLGLWTCASIQLNKRCPHNVKRSLLLFIGILLVMPINGYLGLILDEPPQFLQSIASTLPWCYGPLMLMLVNDAVQRTQSFAALAPQFFPFACLAIIHHSKLEWLQFELYHGFLFLQILLYLGLIASTLYAYRRKLSILGSEFKNSTYHWLLYLVAGIFVILLYDNTLLLLLHFGVPIRFMMVAVTIAGISIYISTIALLLLLQPNIFEQKIKQAEKEGSGIGEIDSSEKHRSAELSDTVVIDLKNKLDRLIDKQKLHLDSEISLAKLAGKLDISNHQLSELLNIHLGTNFYDFLNAKRFEEAVALMTNSANKHSITDIAFLSGFNNRNSFYRVFKNNTGLTPGEFRKQIASNSRHSAPLNTESSL